MPNGLLKNSTVLNSSSVMMQRLDKWEILMDIDSLAWKTGLRNTTKNEDIYFNLSFENIFSIERKWSILEK